MACTTFNSGGAYCFAHAVMTGDRVYANRVASPSAIRRNTTAYRMEEREGAERAFGGAGIVIAGGLVAFFCWFT